MKKNANYIGHESAGNLASFQGSIFLILGGSTIKTFSSSLTITTHI